jgi:NADH dehydrogenase
MVFYLLATERMDQSGNASEASPDMVRLRISRGACGQRVVRCAGQAITFGFGQLKQGRHMAQRVVVIGCGFAGLAAAHKLSAALDRVQTTVIDRHPFMHYRPLLPDVLSGVMDSATLLSRIEPFARRYGFSFVRAEVRGIDFDAQRVIVDRDIAIPYDYCIIAAGSETNFYGLDALQAAALKLDTVNDAQNVFSSISAGGYDHIVIVGGGYTGVETATHIRRFFDAHGAAPRIEIVERNGAIVRTLPRWIQDYVLDNLQRMDIGAAVNTTVTEYENRSAKLSDGREWPESLLVWTAGMKGSSFAARLGVETAGAGRLAVDNRLMVRENVFAAGNIACYRDGDACARMAAHMAIQQGERAADNCIRLARGKEPQSFRPADLGYLVPMANWRSCGVLFGTPVSGASATALHYLINAYRSRGLMHKATALYKGMKSMQRHQER